MKHGLIIAGIVLAYLAVWALGLAFVVWVVVSVLKLLL